jgi:hypothetical protein
MKRFLLLIVILLSVGCSKDNTPKIKHGLYEGAGPQYNPYRLYAKDTTITDQNFINAYIGRRKLDSYFDNSGANPTAKSIFDYRFQDSVYFSYTTDGLSIRMICNEVHYNSTTALLGT